MSYSSVTRNRVGLTSSEIAEATLTKVFIIASKFIVTIVENRSVFLVLVKLNSHVSNNKPSDLTCQAKKPIDVKLFLA